LYNQLNNHVELVKALGGDLTLQASARQILIYSST